jgi:hypothetical protein
MSADGSSLSSAIADKATAEHSGIDMSEVLEVAQRSATSITELAESARASAIVASENQKLSSTVLAEAQTRLTDITTAATHAAAARTQIADEQAIIATKSDHIQKAQEHADKVRGDLDRTLTAAKHQATEAEGLKSRAQSSADTAGELLTAIRACKSAIDADAASVSTANETARKSAEKTKALADIAATMEERIAAYEEKLTELETLCKMQLTTISGLLPGATSAGLAHAFDARRQTFLKPRDRWQWLFVGSILALVALAVTGLWQVFGAGSSLTYDALLLVWLSRFPIAGALVWLALHASRESALAKRLEEDCGYKSAIASSFQGFHKQMTEIGATTAANSPLAKLCADTLTTIGSPPGRIYDKHNLTVTPAAELTDAARAMAEAVKAPKIRPTALGV